MQAAGRAVRSEMDEANLWFLDRRFGEEWWVRKLNSVVAR
jgi:Rad3-related DNA helicase